MHVRVIATRIDRRCHNWSVIQLLTTRFTYRDEAGWRERLAAGEFTIDGKPASPEDSSESEAISFLLSIAIVFTNPALIAEFSV